MKAMLVCMYITIFFYSYVAIIVCNSRTDQLTWIKSVLKLILAQIHNKSTKGNPDVMSLGPLHVYLLW